MNPPNRPPLPLLLVLAYLGFIAYGSLVPLDYTPQSLDFAWARFQQTQMLQLGIESRADWIANGILYIPAGFLVAEWLTGHVTRTFRIPAMFLAFAICVALAFGIEFTQLFFPPRTVSQNDILAESIGSLVGITLAPYLGHWLRQLLAYRPDSHSAGITLILSAYLLAYLAYSLFPYDFLVTSNELSVKLNSNQWGILFARNEIDGRAFLIIVKLGIEVAAAIPFGIFLIRRSQNLAPSPARVILPGALLGIAIELAQLFIYTGSSQGISVITRAIGSYAGALLWLHGRHVDDSRLRALLKRSTWILLPIYLLGIAALTGWFSQHWGSFESARISFEKTRLLPFYYHYFTSEAVALRSLATIAFMYSLVGVFAWARKWHGFAAALFAAFLAIIFETSRLFFPDTHADPTNVLIAAISSWIVVTLIAKLTSTHAKLAANIGRTPANEAASVRSDSTTTSQFTPLDWLTLLTATGFSLVWLMDFPVQPLILFAALVVCAVAVWVKPILIIALIPTALPILDLAPWSGRFFLDEFDILLLVTLAIGYSRTKPVSLSTPSEKLLIGALGFLVLSFAISISRVLLPLPSVDASSFASYFSPYNALRISKGLLSALLFIGLYRRFTREAQNSFQWFAWGTSLGLAITVALIAREKALFGGLLDFNSEYRATGPFSAIHIGGAFIECYLAIAAPFLIFLTIRTKTWFQRIAGTALLLATTYALMITVSRNGFTAYAVACVGALLASLAGGGSKVRRLTMVAVLATTTVAVAVPIFKGDFAQQRMAQVANDLGVRIAHWRDGLAMRQDDWLTELFGMGVGRYPATHYWSSRENIHTSAYSPIVEAGNIFLRIVPGNTLYVEQAIEIEPHQDYFLGFDLRSPTPNPKAGIALCEKSMLASTQCATWQSVERTTEANAWTRVEIKINSAELGTGNFLTRHPAKLSFFSKGSEIIDIDNVKVTSATGQELITNGDFSKHMDRWFFSTDEHLAWHIKSLPAAVLFDLGWFGILAFAVFLALALITSARVALAGSVQAGIVLSATLGFLVVGIFDTLIDAPRFLFLLVFLAWLGGTLGNQKQSVEK